MSWRLLLLPFTPRLIVLTLCVIGLAGSAVAAAGDRSSQFILPMLAFGGLCALGLRDLLQKEHAILRAYPISGHLRFLLETVRPELRQYFFEDNKDGRPFSRDKRAIVYQRAKMNIDKRPFGTEIDVYQEGYEWLRHSIAARPVSHEHFRTRVGADCARPYDISLLNISAMSFGALSANAIAALNLGARKGGFAQDTGEGGFSPYHQQAGGDVIWQIASGYFGCRTRDGAFDPEKFAAIAASDTIKMIEVKLSQGAKPGHGGVLPGAKVTAEIAAHSRHSGRRGLRVTGDAFGLLDADRIAAIPRAAARAVGRQAGRRQALRRACRGSSWGSARRWRRRGSRPISSSSTARRAAPARRRWSSWIISACRCATASPSCIMR